MATEDKTFIITLKEAASADKFKEYISSIGGVVKHEYNLIKGFAITLPDVHLTSLKAHEDVATVEEDQEVHTQ